VANPTGPEDVRGGVTPVARAAIAAPADLSLQTRARLLRWLSLTDSVDLPAALLAGHLAVDVITATRIAEALATAGVFECRQAQVCPQPECQIVLSEDSLSERSCQTCGADLTEFEPRTEVRYLLERPRARDVGWLVAVHGIRTRGPWQEQLQWLIDRQFTRTIPFKNWKYGRILVGSLLLASQRKYVRRFIDQIRSAQSDLNGTLRGGPAPAPDVVAHSFGSWIVAHAIQEDSTLILGSVILVGSIVAPDWPWGQFIDRRQVTAVLNYCGDRDIPVRLAELFVPDSGPSGVVGFTSRHQRVINILRPGGDHSSTFSDDRLAVTFDTVWRPFLSARYDDIDTREHVRLDTPQWLPAPRLLRAPTTLVLLVGSLLVLATIAIIVAVIARAG
jgi:hypothetical protein